MFRLLARWLKAGQGASNPDPDGDAISMFRLHPIQLHRYLEEVWAVGGFEPYPVTGTTIENIFLGDPGITDDLALPDGLVTGQLRSGIPQPPALPLPPPVFPPPRAFYEPILPPPGIFTGVKQPWEHLIYAYLIENTGVVRIFRRVLEMYASGERLEVPSLDSRRWLRSTEELFFRDPPPFHISSITSMARPDLEAARRYAYRELLGIDLNHGRADGTPYPYPRDASANTDFVAQWEAFLREVWQGYINRRNSSGENSTDPEAVANIADFLAKMQRVRRQNGNLAREEFFHTAMMSWFHLTLESDTPIVVDLKANAANAVERLRKIGERVGIAPHPKTRNFFELAEPASSLLRFIELEQFSDASRASVLFDQTPVNRVREDALVVINHWAIATGRNLKLRRLREGPPTRTGPRPAVSAPPAPGPATTSAPMPAAAPALSSREVVTASANGHGR
jgi:hypothetical protein